MCQHSLQDQIIHALSSDALQLPAFPAVAMKLQQALSSPNAKIADLETLIINDQALSSQILRVANSSFYQGLQRVVSIRKAIIRLGARQVASLALSIAQRSLYVTRSALLGRYMERLWRHAFVSATGCQWLASHCGHKQGADAAYMAGLLHDIGQLVILRVMDDLCAGQNSGDRDLPEALLIEVLESSMHNAQGCVLMRRWNLPEDYFIVARDHHREPCDPNQTLLLIVRLIDQVCAKMGIGLSNDPQIDLAATPEAQALGVGEIHLAQLEILLEDSMAMADQI